MLYFCCCLEESYVFRLTSIILRASKILVIWGDPVFIYLITVTDPFQILGWGIHLHFIPSRLERLNTQFKGQSSLGIDTALSIGIC